MKVEKLHPKIAGYLSFQRRINFVWIVAIRGQFTQPLVIHPIFGNHEIHETHEKIKNRLYLIKSRIYY